MNISRTNIDDLNAVIKIEIEGKDYESKVESVLNNYRKKANIPGFRKGNVPLGIIKKQYQKAVIADEVNKLVSDNLEKYIKKEKIELLGSPMPKDNNGLLDWRAEKMTFEFELGLSPKFDINLNVLKKVTHYQIEPDKKMIEEQLDYLRNQYGKLVTREKVQNKYEIIAEFKNENIDINKIGNFKLEEVKSKKAINELKAAGVGKIFQIKIEGLFKESTTMKRITNFDDNKLEEISANEITIEIKEINERVPALLNQELFDKLYEKGSVKTEKDLKGKIKIGLENQFKPQSNQKLINDISETIVEKTKFKLPEDFLKNWIQNSGKEPLTEKEALEEFKRSEKGIRYQLIEGKIIKENNLNYTFEELQNYAKKIVESQMKQYGQSIDKKQVDALVSKVLTNQKETKRISEQLIGEKMIKFYLEKAPLKKKKVGFDVFIKEAYGKA